MKTGVLVILSCSVLIIGALPATGSQHPCLRWADIPPSNAPDDMVLTLTVYDDGGGPLLYAGGYFNYAGNNNYVEHVARWDGVHWSALPGGGLGSGQNDNVRALIEYNDPTMGPLLVAGGSFTMPGLGCGISKWGGGAWSEFGFHGVGLAPCPGSVLSALAVDGNTLYIAGGFTTVDGVVANSIAQWNGSVWSALGSGFPQGSGGAPGAMTIFDDGQGHALYVGGSFSSVGGIAARNLAKWNGATWMPVGNPPLDGVNGVISALAVYDDGHGSALYAAGRFQEAGGLSANQIARWDGTNWSSLGSGIDPAAGRVLSLVEFDDGNGPGLYAGGDFQSAGSIPVENIARWDGTTWSALGSGVGTLGSEVLALCPSVSALRVHSINAGGLFNLAGALPARDFGVWGACTWPVSEFCFGDGTVAACPCSNQGAIDHGCENSLATGGSHLSASGSTSPDTVVLHSTGELPTPLSIVLQGDSLISATVAFGDGLRCAGGNLKRLYIKSAVNGQVSVPTGSDPSITVRSGALGDPLPPGATRYYQVYYRDPNSSFCPAPAGSTFNVTNGIRIVW
jgi:hypothetical protein